MQIIFLFYIKESWGFGYFFFRIIFNTKSYYNILAGLKSCKGGRERHWLAEPKTLGEKPSLLLHSKQTIFN